MSDSPYIFEITAENFQQIVLQGSHEVPVLVDFWADWCQPCKMLMPVLGKLVDEYRGKFILAKINTEEQQAVAAQFGIRSIPTVKLFINGGEVDEFAGALPENEIRAFIDKHLPRETDGVVESAEQLLAAGDAQAALDLLAPAQAADPNNYRILIALAQAQAMLGNWEAATFALDALPEDEQQKPEVGMLRGQMYFAEQAPPSSELPELRARMQADENDSEARYKLSLAMVMMGNYAAATDGLLLLMEKDRAYGEDAARLTLLKLFEMLGDDPLVSQSRRRMFNLMH